MEFEKFPKIPRLRRDIVITEKIDGTNAQVTIIRNFGNLTRRPDDAAAMTEDYVLYAGSRTRWIQPGNDNYGFATWINDNAETLVADLGEGQHFGEWWGRGIQRRYGLDHKRFSLFNTSRWDDMLFITPNMYTVPLLYTGDWKGIDDVLAELEGYSYAAEGFTEPEGIVIFQPASQNLYKVTFDDTHKG